MSIGSGKRANGKQYRTRAIAMADVREHNEDFAVEFDESYDRPAILAFNESGYNSTAVDVLDLIAWLKKNKPELL
jgi:hypothetical protein